MKDIKSSLGGSTYPADENPGTLKAIIVRSKGAYGRRVGILTENDSIIAGSKLHAADYRHEPTPVAQLPEGFTNGVVVELAPERTYHTAFTFQNTAPFEATSSNPAGQMGNAIIKGLDLAVPYDPDTSVRGYPTGNARTESPTLGRNHVSFTLIYAGETYDLGMDFTKHPAMITADLNFALANIHPNLRCYVAMQEAVNNGGYNNWEVKIAVPAGVTIQLPRTDYVTETLQNDVLVCANYGSFKALHLNNALPEGITLTDTVRSTYAMEPLVDPNLPASKSVAELVADSYQIGQQINNPLDGWLALFDIPAEKFHPYIHDPRYRIALVEINPAYYKGDLNTLDRVNYNLNGQTVMADLMVVPRTRTENDPDFGQTYGTRLIDIPASLAAGKLVSVPDRYNSWLDAEQTLPERGGLNHNLADGDIYGSRFAVAVIAPPNAYNRFSPLFREPTGTAHIEIALNRDAVTDPVFDFEPQVYDWDKSTDNKFPLKFKLSKLSGGEIVSVDANVWGLSIVEPSPIVTDLGDDWEVEFHDGFSGRELTFGYSAGNVAIGVSMTRGQNGSAITRLGYSGSMPYTVVTPVVESRITLNNIPRFVIDPNNPDTVEFTGTVEKPTDPTNPDQKEPLYYASGTEIRTKINDNDVFGTVTQPVAGDDAVGTYKVAITKGWLSNLGVGLHTLKVELDVNLYWDNAKLLNVATVEFEVLPEIEGTEDDITFIPAESFDQSPDTVSPMRIVDMDSGEILAEGTNAESLKADALERGLVDVELIFGNLNFIEDDAINPVSIGIEGTWTMEVDGVVVGTGTMEELKPLALAEEIEITPL